MTATKSILTSVTSAAFLVIVARVFVAHSLLAAFVLEPGGAICVLIFGVHGEWRSSGEIVMIGVSFVFWFIVFLVALVGISVLRAKRNGSLPNHVPDPTLPSGTPAAEQPPRRT